MAHPARQGGCHMAAVLVAKFAGDVEWGSPWTIKPIKVVAIAFHVPGGEAVPSRTLSSAVAASC